MIKFVYVGNFAAVHRIDFCLGLLSQLDISMQVDLFGRDEAGRFEFLSGEYGSANIIFHGYAERSRILAAIKSSDLGIGIFGLDIKSRHSETNKILEYAQFGLPVFTFHNDELENLFPRRLQLMFYVEENQCRADMKLDLFGFVERFRGNKKLRDSLIERTAFMRSQYPEIFSAL